MSVCVCVCVRACVCVCARARARACVCVCEGEGRRERERARRGETRLHPTQKKSTQVKKMEDVEKIKKEIRRCSCAYVWVWPSARARLSVYVRVWAGNRPTEEARV